MHRLLRACLSLLCQLRPCHQVHLRDFETFQGQGSSKVIVRGLSLLRNLRQHIQGCPQQWLEHRLPFICRPSILLMAPQGLQQHPQVRLRVEVVTPLEVDSLQMVQHRQAVVALRLQALVVQVWEAQDSVGPTFVVLLQLWRHQSQVPMLPFKT